MSNLLKIKSKLTAMEKKIKEINQQVNKEKENGIITNEVELKHRFFSLMKDYYNNIGKPTMKVREAWGPPFSSDYNQTMEEIQNDIYTLFDETNDIKKEYENTFIQLDSINSKLKEAVKEFKEKINEYEFLVQQKTNEQFFKESFKNYNKYEKDFVDGKMAFISKDIGGLILSPIVSEELTDGVAKIKDGSKGFPGNTHQVRVINGNIIFYGESDAHWNLAKILDKNNDTWFEFEKYDISDEVYDKTNGFGFNYEEKIKWIFDKNEEKEVKLIIEIDYKNKKQINWVSLYPFIPSEKGAGAPIIEKIELHNGKGGKKIIAEQEKFDNSKIYMFDVYETKKIEISILQKNGYDTKIGHLFFKELETKNENFLNKSNNIAGRRIEGPMPSIEELHMKWNKEKQEIEWQSYEEGFEFENEEKRKQKLFYPPKTNEYVQAGFEYLPAKRYMIGLRDVSCLFYQFEETSEYVSKPFHCISPIWFFELESDEYIPDVFNKDEEWISYYFSLDDGQSWYEIKPKNQKTKEKFLKTYWINTNTPKELRNRYIEYIETQEPVYSFRLKIKLRRPTGMVGYTPVVKEVRIKTSTIEK
ncbi:MAG: hypothetical protein N2043_02055 [Ignavibacterium sp.]|nr:hypothetical protein [Ignavibacterium sp.]